MKAGTVKRVQTIEPGGTWDESHSNPFFKTIFDHSDFGIVLTDADGNIVSANNQFLKIDFQPHKKIDFSSLVHSNRDSDRNESMRNSGAGMLRIASIFLPKH